MSCETTIYLLNSTQVYIDDLAVADVAGTGFVVTWTLYSVATDGTQATLATGTMSYHSDSGEYRGQVDPDDLTTVADGDLGRLVYDVGSGDGGWDEPVVFRRRRFTQEECSS